MFKVSKFLAIIALFLFVVIMGSCGGGGGGGGGEGTTPTTTDSVSSVIDTAGGTLTTPSGNATLTVPPGAVSNNTTINISQSTEGEPQGTITGSYKITSGGLTFNAPITISLKYDPVLIPEGVNEANLKLAYESGGDWVILSDSTVDVVNHIVSGKTDHLSTYSIVPNTSEKLAFGELIGDFNSVKVYSNGNIGNVSNDYNSVSGVTTGMKWQCVEYVNRYYQLVYNKNIRIPGTDAIDYYKTAADRGLITYDNGGSVPPQPGDILISEGGDFGHVAIVREVTANIVYVTQQNWFNNYGDLNVPVLRVGNHLDGFGGSKTYTIRGWLRLSSTEDKTRPTTPTGLNAVAISSTQINLSWNASTDNVGVTGYKIFDYYGTYLKSVNSTSASFTGLSPNTNYCFSVSAYDATGNESGKSSQVCSTTPSGGGVPPGALTLTVTLECSGEGTPQIRLTWTSSLGVDYYNIYKNGSLYEGVSSNVTTFVDTAVTTGMTYSYFIRAINSGGQIDSNAFTVTATCQGILPGIFTLTAIPWCNGSNPIIHLEWGGSAGRTLPYELYRYGTLLFTTDFNNYDDTAVTAGTTYNYFVRAKNSVGYRDSNTVPVTSKSDCGAPVSPVINTISPQSVTVGTGGFTLTITGQYFDSTAKILWAFSGQTPAIDVYTTFVDSSTLTVQVTQNSGGFSPFLYPGALVIQVIKPGPNFWDGQRSNIMSFTILNPVPIVNSISGTCRANLNCTPANGYDVRINGSGFVNNIAYINGSYVSSTYAQINGSETPVLLMGQGPVTSQMQLYVNGLLIPTPGTYTVNVCNAGTIQGTACSTGSLTVTP